MFKKSITITLLFSLILLAAKLSAANILWQDNFQPLQVDNKKAYTGWRFMDITGKSVNDVLQISETGVKNYGHFYRYIPYDLRVKSAFKYIQVKIGRIGKAADELSLDNSSTGGKHFGRLFPGWNTFSLESQPAMQGKKGWFACSITQLGTRGSGKSSSADIELVRVIKTPLNGLTIDLKSATKAQIGSQLLFRYYATQKLKKLPQVKCFIAPGMIEYNLIGDKNIILNDSGKNGDVKAGDKVYSAVVKINKDCQKFISSEKSKLFVSTIVNGRTSSAYAAFECDIQGTGKMGRVQALSPSPVGKYGTLWNKETAGENLALGKPVIFSKKPAYSLTVKGETDQYDLTDGQLSHYAAERIWFDNKAVGWFLDQVDNGVTMIIDLGKVQPVAQVVVRCLAGKEQNILISPGKLELFVSKDGKNYYQTASMQKLMAGEKSQSDLRRFFYIEENGTPYVYPFVLEAQANARYIGVRIFGDADSIFCDELAVIKASKTALAMRGYNQVYSKQPQELHTEGFIIKPHIGKLVIAENILVPNILAVEDMSGKKNSRPKIKLIIETPLNVKLLKPDSNKTIVNIDGRPFNRQTLPMRWGHSSWNISTPLFFSVDGKIDNNATATFYVEYPGVKIIKSTVPVEAVKFPIVKPEFKRLTISLAWMDLNHAEQWPEFLSNWRKLGFNTIACFPRYWTTDSAEKQRFLAKARSLGYKIIMNESPFHEMAKPFYKQPGAEIFSQLPSGKSKNICPSYHGKYYQKELERIAANVKKSQPDYIFWDIECWYHGAIEAAKCSRCSTGQQRSGKPMAEYLRLQGKRAYADLYTTVKKSCAGKMPIIGSYNQHAVHPVHHLVADFNLIFPEYVQLIQPSLYVAGQAQEVHDSIRKNYQLTKSRNIIPWLSTGTYGELEPYKVEQMVLEALLNGATGITYYWYGDFDTSLDFYYHTKALAEIAPYENLIMDGQVLEPTGSNKKLTYSAIRNKNEMLLLIGNYASGKPETLLNMPFTKVTAIKDLRSGKTLTPATKLKLTVPQGAIRLFYIKGE